MTPVRLIGIGSPHGTDRRGWQLVEALQHWGIEQQTGAGLLSAENCAVPAQLFQLIDGCELAILIDVAKGCSGTVERLEVNDLVAGRSCCSVHGFGVVESLQLVACLAESPPQIVLIGVSIEDEPAAEISDSAWPQGLQMLPVLSAMIAEEIVAYCSNTHDLLD